MKYYVGPDAYSHGETQANTLIEMFPDGCNYVVIAGTAGHMQTIYMDKAMDETSILPSMSVSTIRTAISPPKPR